MKKNLHRSLTVLTAIICLSGICFSHAAHAQTTIFADSFQSTANISAQPKLPSGWTTTGGSKKWVFTNYNAAPTGTPPVNYSFAADANPSHGAIYGVSLDTVLTLTSPDLFAGKMTSSYKTISVSWVEMFSPKWIASNDSANSVAYSIDGTTWDTLAHSRFVTGANYGITNAGTPIALPSNAVGAAHLYLRWTFIPKKAAGNYAMTDVVVTGTTGNNHTSGINETIYASNNNINAFYYNGSLNVHFMDGNNGMAQMGLYNIQGKLIQSSAIHTSADQVINLGNLPAGVYFARFTMNGQVYNTKFVR